MIRVYNNSILVHNNDKYYCALGKSGINSNKKEGDNTTPAGSYYLGNIYYRKERIIKLKTKRKVICIEKNMFWSDDVNSINYNRLINIKEKKCEALYRRDNIYDIFIIINYNLKPVIPGKGSAIFLHVARKNYTPTKGCVAVKKKDLLKIISKLEKNEKIVISDKAYISA